MDALLTSRAPAGAQRLALPGLTAVLAGMAVLQGAYWTEQLMLAAAACVLLAVITRAPLGGPFLVGMAVIVAGAACSIVVAGRYAAAGRPILIAVVALAAFAVARRALRLEGATAVADAVIGVAALVAVAGLIGVAWKIEPLGLRADTWRLASTLTYQNAAAALLAMALGPALVMAGRRPGRIARALPVVIGVALLATLSRGGYVAAAVSLLWMLRAGAIRRGDVAWFGAAIAVGGAAILPATLGWSWAGPVSTVGVVFAVWFAARTGSGRANVPVLIVCGIGLVAALLVTPLGDRFTFSSTDRARVWSHTLHAAAEHPWFGSGLGTYELLAPAGDRIVRTRYAHNEYLQWFAETGILGTAALIAGVVIMVRAVRSRRPRDGALRSAAVAALVGFSVHAATDFVWHVPVLVGVAVSLLAVAVAEEEPS